MADLKGIQLDLFDIEVMAGDVIKLRNTCVSDVNLNPAVNGSLFPITIASINIECLKELP